MQACADAFARRDFIFFADFSDVSVCTTLFLSRIFRTFRFARRYFCRGFFGRFGLHDVIFVADFSDVSVCTTLLFLSLIFLMLQFARLYFCRGFFGVSVCTTLFLLPIFRTLQFARRYFCPLLLLRMRRTSCNL